MKTIYTMYLLPLSTVAKIGFNNLRIDRIEAISTFYHVGSKVFRDIQTEIQIIKDYSRIRHTCMEDKSCQIQTFCLIEFELTRITQIIHWILSLTSIITQMVITTLGTMCLSCTLGQCLAFLGKKEVFF